jgi:hypothetical protein
MLNGLTGRCARFVKTNRLIEFTSVPSHGYIASGSSFSA